MLKHEFYLKSTKSQKVSEGVQKSNAKIVRQWLPQKSYPEPTLIFPLSNAFLTKDISFEIYPLLIKVIQSNIQKF